MCSEQILVYMSLRQTEKRPADVAREVPAMEHNAQPFRVLEISILNC